MNKHLDERAVEVTRHLMTYHVALLHDVPLTDQDVKESWDDRFLTNIMIPYLQHIVREYQTQLEELDRTEPPYIIAGFYYREQLRSLENTILVLEEWRG